MCLLQGLFSFGAMCSYLVIVADTLPPVSAVATLHTITPPSPALSSRGPSPPASLSPHSLARPPQVLLAWTNWGSAAPSLVKREVVLAAVSCLLLLPLCLYRAYGQLAKYSIVKAVAVGMLLVTVLVSAAPASAGGGG